MNMKTYALSYSIVKYLNDREPMHRALDQSEVGYYAAELSEAIELSKAIKEGNSNEIVGYITSLNEEIDYALELSFKHKLNETDAKKLYWLVDVRQQLIDAICPQVCEFCKHAKDTGNGNYKCWLTQY